jgi:hypothetical protein
MASSVLFVSLCEFREVLKLQSFQKDVINADRSQYTQEFRRIHAEFVGILTEFLEI